MKIKQSETIIILRSKINFASYNPRKKDKKVIDALIKNFKSVGFLGGIQWNSLTGNLIGGHKRLEALDVINKYDSSPEKDYEVKVEKIELTEKQEKEQNIFLNNKRAQGETDFFLMAELIKDIDIENAAIEEYDINLIESIVPDFKFADNSKIKEDSNQLTEDAKKAHNKKVKAEIKESIASNHTQTHFTITFKTYDEKAEYLSSIGINEDSLFITSKVFLQKISQ